MKYEPFGHLVILEIIDFRIFFIHHVTLRYHLIIVKGWSWYVYRDVLKALTFIFIIFDQKLTQKECAFHLKSIFHLIIGLNVN